MYFYYHGYKGRLFFEQFAFDYVKIIPVQLSYHQPVFRRFMVDSSINVDHREWIIEMPDEVRTLLTLKGVYINPILINLEIEDLPDTGEIPVKEDILVLCLLNTDEFYLDCSR